MTIRKLEVYYVVSEVLNMTIAAKKLYISQPSISQIIKELETDMEVKLFQRAGRKLYLTEEGKIFQKYCLRILNLYKESQKIIKDMKELKAGELKIGSSTTIGTYLLPDIIADFKKDYPNVNIKLFIANTEDIAEKLLESSIDIGFVEGVISFQELNSIKFWEDELVIISPPSYKWNKIITLELLRNNSFIQREEGSGTRKTYESIGISNENNLFTFGSTEAIKRAVKKNFGISCVSKFAVEEEVQRGEIIISRLDNISIKRDLKLLHHKDKPLSNLINNFLEFSKNYNFNC